MNVVSLLLCLYLCLGWLLAGAFAQSAISQPAKRIPVTVIYRVTYYDRNGNPAATQYLVWAYRSDGSNAKRMLSTSKYEVIDYQRGIMVLVDPRTRSITKQQLPPNARPPVERSCEEAWGRLGHECAGPVAESMLGFRLERVIHRDQATGREVERLVAPDLQYITLKRWSAVQMGQSPKS